MWSPSSVKEIRYHKSGAAQRMMNFEMLMTRWQMWTFQRPMGKPGTKSAINSADFPPSISQPVNIYRPQKTGNTLPCKKSFVSLLRVSLTLSILLLILISLIFYYSFNFSCFAFCRDKIIFKENVQLK